MPELNKNKRKGPLAASEKVELLFCSSQNSFAFLK